MICMLKSELYKSRHNPFILMTIASSFILAAGINIFSKASHSLIQFEVMSYLFPILPSLIVGGVWAMEYAEGTIRYIFTAQSSKKLIFGAKTITTIFLMILFFASYVLGLICTDWHTFVDFNRGIILYLVPMFLLISHSFTLIFIAVISKSFSQTSLLTIILFLFYFFCYKMVVIYESGNMLLNMIANSTFSGIFVYAYYCSDIQTLLLRSGINMGIGIIFLLLAFCYFQYTDVC